MATQTAAGTASPPRPKRRSLADRLKMAAKTTLDSPEQRAAQQTLEAMDKAKDTDVTINVTPDIKSHIVTQNVTSDKESHDMTDSVTSDIKSHITTNNVTPDKKGHMVTQKVISDKESHIVTDKVSSDTESHIVTHEVTPDIQSHTMTQNVTTDIKSHALTPKDTSDNESHIVTQNVTPLEDKQGISSDTSDINNDGPEPNTSDTMSHMVTNKVSSDRESHILTEKVTSGTEGHPIKRAGHSATSAAPHVHEETVDGDWKSHDVTQKVTTDIKSHTLTEKPTRGRPRSSEGAAIRSPQIRSTVQVELYDHLFKLGASNERLYTSVGRIAKTLQVTSRSILRIFSQWEDSGIIDREANYRGTGILLLKLPHEVGLVASTPYQAPSSQQVSGIPSAPRDSREDEMSVLGITATYIREEYPNLYRAGFGLHQLQQVEQRLGDANLPTDMVRDSLGFAEYELEHDLMRDSKGNPVDSPADWLFKCLCKSGVYRRPKGYIDPLEAARCELEAQIAQRRKRMADLAKLREEQAMLEQEEVIEERVQQVMSDPDSEEYKRYTVSIPDFIRSKGSSSSMFQRAVRLAIKNELFPEGV